MCNQLQVQKTNSTLTSHGAYRIVFCSTHFHMALLWPYIKDYKMLHALVDLGVPVGLIT